MPAAFWFTISWMLVRLRLMSAVTQDCSSAAVATWALAPLIWLTASVMPPSRSLHLGGEALVAAEDLQGLLHAAVGGEGLALQLLDDDLDLLGGVLGPGRQQTHLVGHHGEAATGLAGAGGPRWRR